MQTKHLVILLAEDDPGDALIATEALERAAGSGMTHHVHVVGDGLEALDFLRGVGRHVGAPRPDLIMLDLNMPKMDGREALALIKDEPLWRPIPVVVFTTSAAEADVLACYLNHANAYVTKPMELDDIDAVVRQIGSFFTTTAALLPSPA